MHNPFRYFNSSPEVIRSAVMLYVRYPLSLRQVEDLLFERGIDICHETVRYWWNRFGPLFAAGIQKRRIHRGLYERLPVRNDRFCATGRQIAVLYPACRCGALDPLALMGSADPRLISYRGLFALSTMQA